MTNKNALEQPIVIVFDNKPQFAVVMRALDMFAEFIEQKHGDAETALMVRDVIQQGITQWDCGDPDCDDCREAREIKKTSGAMVQKLLGLPPEGEA